MNQYQPPSQPGPWGQQPQEGYNQPQQPSMQPQKKPRKPVSRRAQIGCVSAIALLVIIIFAAIAANGGGSNASPTTSNQSQVTATQPTSQPTQAPQSIGQQVDSIVQNAGLLGKAKTSYQSDGTVTVTDDIGDGNLTNSLTVGEIHLECFTAEKALWTSGIASKLSDVTVNITMNVVDQYGNQSNSQVASCDLTKSTEQLFNWGNLDQDMAWNDYDNTTIAPFLTK